MRSMKLQASLIGLFLFLLTPFGVRAEERSIKIGVLTDQNGPVSDLSGKGSIVATQLAIEDFKQFHPEWQVTTIVGDHQNKPDVGVAIARRWFDESGVDAIVDVPTSSVGLAVQNLVKQKNKVFLNTGGTSSEFTGPSCTDLATQWSTDSYIISNGITRSLVKQGLDTWFLFVTDYTFGLALERDSSKAVQDAGGQVIGAVRHPIDTQDFSSFLLRAQSSGAKIIALANTSGDTIRSIQQAREFGVSTGQQKIVPFVLHLTDVHSLGLQDGQGIVFMDGFYWDRDAKTKAWTMRFMQAHSGRAPTSIQAGAYSAVTHYLKSVAASVSKDAHVVSAKMKELAVDDSLISGGSIRSDGKVVKDYYLLQVKAPSESKHPWDYLRILSTIPGTEVIRPLSEGGCVVTR